MKTVRRPVLAIALLVAASSAWTADLGTIGPTYGISEPHLLNFIEQRLREKERSGELQQLIEQAQARGIDAVKRPQPAAGLQPTVTARTFYFDPSFTLDRNITDARGQLLFAAGTRKNPLDVVSLSKHLLFFDARDRRQVTRARELMARYAGKVKPILTGGSYLDLMKVWRIPVYYDQQGTLTRRFGIRQVPEAVLFANPIAVAACAADCVAATAGFGIAEMFWCAGCQGGIYPFDGHVPYHMGGVRTAELLAQRLTAKMHRELLAWGWHGKAGLCGPYFLPAMDKTAYKAQLTYPVANTAKDGGRCCQPFGRSTIVWGAGKEYPVRGEDFAFMLFRKRNCCVGY